mgnify:CR=1 FL=1
MCIRDSPQGVGHLQSQDDPDDDAGRAHDDLKQSRSRGDIELVDRVLDRADDEHPRDEHDDAAHDDEGRVQVGEQGYAALPDRAHRSRDEGDREGREGLLEEGRHTLVVEPGDEPVDEAADDEGDEDETVTRLARVGYDNVLGYLKGGIAAWKNAGRDADSVESISAKEFAERMKAGHDITVNRARAKAISGGDWAAMDPVAQGRVSLRDAGGEAAQAVAALDELQRLSKLDSDWSWRRCAVIARDWRRLEPVRAYAEALGIPIDMANETLPSLWRLREMQGFVRTLLADRTRLLTISDLVAILTAQPQSRWTDLIGEGIGTLARELVEKAAPVPAPAETRLPESIRMLLPGAPDREGPWASATPQSTKVKHVAGIRIHSFIMAATPLLMRL